MVGYCECGCGRTTLPYANTSARNGAVKGHPARFIKGHNNATRGAAKGVDISEVMWDSSDGELVGSHVWYVGTMGGKKRYAFTRIDGKTTYMHRLLMNAPDGVEVDHINGNGLDNRRSNLRLATRQQNCVNRPPVPNKTSRFKGVSWCRSSKKWVAVIHTNRKKTTLGYFVDEKEAARAYDKEASIRFGEFAFLNNV